MAYIPEIWESATPKPQTQSPVSQKLRDWFGKTAGARCYRKKMKVYVPVSRNVNGGVKSCRSGVNEFIKDINKNFKGSTVYDAVGSWYNAGYCSNSNKFTRRDCTKAGAKWTVVDKVETEPIKVVEIGYGTRGGECLEEKQALGYIKAVTKYANACNQWEVAITDDGEFFMGGTEPLTEVAIQEYGVKRRKK